MKADLNEPWLVAAWPGMGAIAQLAGSYLVHQLGPETPRAIGEIPPEPYFEVQSIRVHDGLAEVAPLPRSRLFAWKHPGGGRDLLLFLGEMQPPTGGYRFCEELVQTAKELGACRVVTFAAIASPILPAAEPRVLAVASSLGLLEELRRQGIERLQEGQIGGLNGVLLTAAKEQGLDGFCLLGEFPYFANAIPNPKSSAAVLRAFAALAGIELDLEPMIEHGRIVERGLTQQLQHLQRAAGVPTPEEEAAEDYGVLAPDRLDPAVESRIETLFEQAQQDRSKALELKAELDRQNVFQRYEDRFLDLFKQAE